VAIWTLDSKTPLVVQVIAQQWKFSYRYPSFGGFETDQLVLPNDTAVVFHVTSLDVIHDFWAYQLGVKADANLTTTNIAYTQTNSSVSFEVRCDELCGLWHGAMFDTGAVVSKSAFQSWAASTEARLASATEVVTCLFLDVHPRCQRRRRGLYPDDKDPYSTLRSMELSR